MPPLFQALSWGPKVGDLDQGDKDWLRRDSAMPKAGKPSRPMCRRKTSHDKRERGLGTMASLQTGTYGEERSTERAKMWGCHRALGNTVREEKETERRSGSWPGPHHAGVWILFQGVTAEPLEDSCDHWLLCEDNGGKARRAACGEPLQLLLKQSRQATDGGLDQSSCSGGSERQAGFRWILESERTRRADGRGEGRSRWDGQNSEPKGPHVIAKETGPWPIQF